MTGRATSNRVRYRCVLCGHEGRWRLRFLHALNRRCWKANRV